MKLPSLSAPQCARARSPTWIAWAETPRSCAEEVEPTTSWSQRAGSLALLRREFPPPPLLLACRSLVPHPVATDQSAGKHVNLTMCSMDRVESRLELLFV
eukprot:754612-Hanusia_phi.AAC.2